MSEPTIDAKGPQVGDVVRCADDENYEWGPVTLSRSYRRRGSTWWVAIGEQSISRFTEECIIEINGREVSYR